MGRLWKCSRKISIDWCSNNGGKFHQWHDGQWHDGDYKSYKWAWGMLQVNSGMGAYVSPNWWPRLPLVGFVDNSANHGSVVLVHRSGIKYNFDSGKTNIFMVNIKQTNKQKNHNKTKQTWVNNFVFKFSWVDHDRKTHPHTSYFKMAANKLFFSLHVN